MNPLPSADTFPRLLAHHASTRPRATAIREKDLGIWQSWTWQQMHQEVSEIAAGLLQAGFKRGQHLAIIGENRPRLYFTMTAVQCLGGIPVPLYEDATAPEMAFVFDNAEIHFAVVEDQEQVDKVLEIREKVPHLKANFLRRRTRSAPLPAARAAVVRRTACEWPEVVAANSRQ